MKYVELWLFVMIPMSRQVSLTSMSIKRRNVMFWMSWTALNVKRIQFNIWFYVLHIRITDGHFIIQCFLPTINVSPVVIHQVFYSYWIHFTSDHLLTRSCKWHHIHTHHWEMITYALWNRWWECFWKWNMYYLVPVPAIPMLIEQGMDILCIHFRYFSIILFIYFGYRFSVKDYAIVRNVILVTILIF